MDLLQEFWKKFRNSKGNFKDVENFKIILKLFQTILGKIS